MIASLTGRLAFKAPTSLVLDVHGVGYEVFIPLSTYYGLPNLSESTSLSVHTHVREDAIQLFGFLTSQEKDAFVLLTSVSGVGPSLGDSVGRHRDADTCSRNRTQVRQPSCFGAQG